LAFIDLENRFTKVKEAMMWAIAAIVWNK